MDIPLIYGTAWKEDRTESLVTTALEAGFRAIDTANQRKHYFEEGVGNAIASARLKREELFIQTKFTFIDGQDYRLPYDADADVSTQVRQSFQKSLEHLRVDYIDSYLLHGPSVHPGLSDDDVLVWKEMEAIHTEELTKHLGVSNVNIDQLQMLFEEATVKPTFVQNRCFAQLGWDKEIREFCKKNGIIYQGFSLLTANRFVLPLLKPIADKYQKTSAQIIFRFAQQVGMIPLTGTTDPDHMKLDLEMDFEMENDEIRFVENIGLD